MINPLSIFSSVHPAGCDSTRRLHRIAALLLLASLFVFPFSMLIPTAGLSSAVAQDSGVSMDAHAAYDGHFKYGEWVPIWVTLENTGADLGAEVQVRVERSFGATVFSVPVSLPSGARKRLPVYILPNNFTREAEVRLVSQGEVVARQNVSVLGEANIVYLIGIASANQGALSQLKGLDFPGQSRPVSLVNVALEDFPERVEGLRSLDTLIFNDIDTSTLTPGQAEALRGWVSGGGRLVLGGGAGAAATVSGISEGLLPVRPAESVELTSENLSVLADFAGATEIQAAGPFLAAGGTLQDGKILVGRETLPLVVSKSLGSGEVYFIALDLSVAPFEGWSGTVTFWESLLGPGAVYSQGMPPDMSARQLRSSSMPYALSNMPVLDLPSVRNLGLLLGAYILLVGPVNYLVLRKQKKLHWAWVTIPAITVLFSASAFGMGYALRGTDVVLNKIALVELNSDGRADVTTYLGLFSPGQQAYEVEVEGSSLLSPIAGYEDPWSPAVSSGTGGEMIFVQGDRGAVRGLSVGQWSMQNFMAENPWPDFGKIDTDLRLENGAVTGTVRNDTDQILEDVTVVLRKQFVRLGDLAPGQEGEVNLQWQGGEEQRFGSSLSWNLFGDQFNNPVGGVSQREAEMKRSIVEAVFERGPMMALKSSMSGTGGPATNSEMFVLGWLRTAPPEIRVSGRTVGQQATTLVYMPATFKIPVTDRLVLPPGMIPGELVETPFEGGYCGDTSSTGVYLSNGEAIFEFRLPSDVLAYRPEVLNMNLWTDMGWWQSPDVALYDWEVDDWRALKEVRQGDNTLSAPDDLINDAGLIRLRLSGENMQGCIFVDMGIEGTRQDGQGG